MVLRVIDLLSYLPLHMLLPLKPHTTFNGPILPVQTVFKLIGFLSLNMDKSLHTLFHTIIIIVLAIKLKKLHILVLMQQAIRLLVLPKTLNIQFQSLQPTLKELVQISLQRSQLL